MGLIRSSFALIENFDGALGKFQKNEQGFAYNDTLFALLSWQCRRRYEDYKQPIFELELTTSSNSSMGS